MDFSTNFGWILGPTWIPKSIQDRSKIGSKIGSNIGTIVDRSWVAFGSVLEATLVLKSTKIGAKTDKEVEAKL